MRQWVGLVAAIGILLCGAGNAAAGGSYPAANFLKEFSKSLPPIGFVRFCANEPGACKRTGLLHGSKLRLTPDLWRDIYRVNRSVNHRIAPATDLELYGEVEHWTYPTTSGDCEDYLLLKKRELEALGFPASALLITVVLDERGEGHAVLTIAGDSGDYVLDNRRDDVLLWSETNYKFLKRQSNGDPKRWVALDGKTRVATSALGTTEN